jgi:tripartite-type tricarboxylate transporter receptor subunit TctC
MPTPRLTLPILTIGFLLCAWHIASAQDYPSKPVRIFTSPAGGANDFTARIVAEGLSAALGQSVIIENRPSLLPGEIVSKATPDGYVLLIDASNLWITPLIQKTSYDPIRDFSAISTLASAPLILVVHPSLPVRSVRDLIQLAKGRPGDLRYSAAQPGSTNQLAAELFKSMAAVNMTGISYKGSALGTLGLLTGEVQIMFGGAAGLNPHIKSGRLRALAVTSAQPSALIPGMPPIAESVPGYNFKSTYAMFAPAGASQAIIARLNRELAAVLNQPDVKNRLSSVGVESGASRPDQLASTVKSEMAMFEKVIKDAGLRLD